MILTYDNLGRLKYCPELHFNHGQPWGKDELDYLIEWYAKIGPEEMSFALGRTVSTVATKASKLRIEGVAVGDRPYASRMH